MLDEKIIIKASNLFKVISDPTRVRILEILKINELSVNEIVEKIYMSQSAVSHQLRLLKDNNLVKSRRDGKNIIYSITDNHVSLILEQTFEHVAEEKCNEKQSWKNGWKPWKPWASS